MTYFLAFFSNSLSKKLPLDEEFARGQLSAMLKNSCDLKLNVVLFTLLFLINPSSLFCYSF